MVLRWWKNRTGRPLSPLQIHQQIIWMLSKFHKATSGCWRRTPGTQNGSPFSLKVGRAKYKRQEERYRVRDGEHPGEGVMKEGKFPNSRKPSHLWFCGEFWNLRGQHNWKEKKRKNQNTHLTAIPSGEVAQTLPSTTSKWGLDRVAWASCLR